MVLSIRISGRLGGLKEIRGTEVVLPVVKRDAAAVEDERVLKVPQCAKAINGQHWQSNNILCPSWRSWEHQRQAFSTRRYSEQARTYR